MSAQPLTEAAVSLRALLRDEYALPARYERSLAHMQLDSRRVRQGDLFIACRGGSQDGRDFIAGAIAGGAAAVLVEAGTGWDSVREDGKVPLIPIADLPRKLARMAARFYGEPARLLRLIGVTGTNGKTTCSLLLARALQRLGYCCGVIGTLGHGLVEAPFAQDDDGPATTPDAVQLQRILHELQVGGGDTVVMEVSSHGLDQGRIDVDDIGIALFTNLSRDHLDYHGSMESYGQAKRRLFTGTRLRHALLNLDDPFSADIRAALPSHTQVLGWSLHDPAADLFASHDTTASGLRLQIRSPWGDGELRSPLLGSFNASNLLGILAAALVCEAEQGRPDLDTCLQAVGALAPVPGRMQYLGGYDVAVVIDYAHTPDGLRSALQAAREHFSGELICLFGCGGDRDRGKRPQMAQVAEALADRIVVTDDNPRFEDSAAIIAQILAGFTAPERVSVIADRAQAIAQTLQQAPAGAVILIAGKGHEAYQDIRGVRQPFSDQTAARAGLQRRFGAGQSLGGRA